MNGECAGRVLFPARIAAGTGEQFGRVAFGGRTAAEHPAQFPDSSGLVQQLDVGEGAVLLQFFADRVVTVAAGGHLG